jgi:hypothetical protein
VSNIDSRGKSEDDDDDDDDDDARELELGTEFDFVVDSRF